MLISLVVYCLLGAIAGVLAGLLGVGGGIVIVPMLVFAFGWQNFPPDVLMLMALGTSMGSIMFTSISSSLAHSRNKGVQWDAVRNITPGILIGTFCGSFLASHVPARFLQLFFVAFHYFVITQKLSRKKPTPLRESPHTAAPPTPPRPNTATRARFSFSMASVPSRSCVLEN